MRTKCLTDYDIEKRKNQMKFMYQSIDEQWICRIPECLGEKQQKRREKNMNIEKQTEEQIFMHWRT